MEREANVYEPSPRLRPAYPTNLARHSLYAGVGHLSSTPLFRLRPTSRASTRFSTRSFFILDEESCTMRNPTLSSAQVLKRGVQNLEHLECSHQPHIQGRGAEKHTQPEPDDWHRVAGKRALAPGVRVRRERAVQNTEELILRCTIVAAALDGAGSAGQRRRRKEGTGARRSPLRLARHALYSQPPPAHFRERILKYKPLY